MDLQELQPEVQRLSQSAQALLDAAGEPITTAVAYEGAVAALKNVKGRYNELDEREKTITKPINDSLKAIRDLFRGPKDLLQKAEAALKRGILTYQQEEERKRQEAQREAERAAEAERQRLAKLAVKAEERGDTAKAEQFQERAAVVVPPIVQSEKPKVAGIATRKDWKAEVTDLSALIKAVAEGKAPARLLKVDSTELSKMARAMQADLNLPGVRTWAEDVLAARAS